MKLGSFRRIIKTDFKPEYQPLVDQLGVSINNGFEQLYDALNKKITFEENIASTIVELTVTVGADGTPSQTTSFKIDKSLTRVNGLIVLNAYGTKNSNLLPTAGVFISFTKNESQIIIKNIKGLQANNQYTLKILTL